MEDKLDDGEECSFGDDLTVLLSKLEATQPAAVVYQTLVTIRCKYNVGDGHQPVLEGCGLVGKLIQLLRRPNSKIVDVSLSLLGNLVMHKKPREQTREHSGIRILVTIISTLADDKILGRACRVIANLSQDLINAKDFLELNAIPLLLRTLKDVGCTKAKGSAIRAIRILCSGTREGKAIALENRALSAIATYLASDDVDLLKVVCKSLSVLTTTTLLPERQVDCNGFKRLIALVGHRKKSVWIPALLTIANVSRVDELRPTLGNVGAVGAVVDAVTSTKKESELSTTEFATVVKALCLYCQESVNRVRLREIGGLKLFVSLLDRGGGRHNSNQLQEHIVFSLLRFGYDAISLGCLAREGVVARLTDFLDEYNDKHHHVHSCCCDDKDDNLMDIVTKNSTPCSTPPGSSSPATSTSSFTLNDSEMMDLSGDVAVIQPPPSEENSFSSSVKKKKSRQTTIVDFSLRFLLRIYEVLSSTEKMLFQPNTFKALVRYVCWTKDPSHTAWLILNRVSKSIETTKSFLLQGLFPWMRLEMDLRLKSSTCCKCQEMLCLFNNVFQEFAFMAETGYIEGAVCHALVNKATDQVKRIVVTVGIVALVVSKTLLFNILVTHGGLDVLLDALERTTTTPELFSHSVLSLSLLAKRVGVVSRIQNSEEEEDRERCCSYAASSSPNDFKLVMEDGTSVCANRQVLVDANGVFEAMLTGTFSESAENEVRLPKTNGSSMRCLVHHLYGCAGCCVLGDDSDPDTWLDLVPLSDKYLLPDLNRIACGKIMRMCTRNHLRMVHAYGSSLNIVCPTRGEEETLNVSLVASLLVGEIPHQVRVQLFEELSRSSELKIDFLDDINSLIINRLKLAMQRPRKSIRKSAG